ncbi:DegT/DnrJ/EryC1/StrS family aminotransferase [Lutibacter sp. B2]|nr:DegT/DnrJ/EryC1/StrS family aminotransferase [Lutibacter sp. B2]
MINIAQPIIDKEEILHVQEVMKSGIIASGKKVLEFEINFAKYSNTRYGVATSSGTTALHAAVIASGIKEGDKVITTPFTFAATANSVLFEKATPIFADINPNTFNIDPDHIENILKNTPDVKALLIVHLYGLPCDMTKIMALVNKYNLILIEDCCQAHGSKYYGENVGNFGITSTYSFYPTKNMTTGEGGMVLTNDHIVYENIKKLINHGQQERYVHSQLGYNFRMTDISAAIGIEQLKKLDHFNNKRIDNASFYNKNIKNDLVTLPLIPKDHHHVYHQYTIKVKDRKRFIDHLQKHEIGFGIYYPVPLNAQPYYKQLGYDPTQSPVAMKLCKEVVSIPVHPGLSKDQVRKIVEVINHYA